MCCLYLARTTYSVDVSRITLKHVDDLRMYFLQAAFSLKSLEYMCIRILMLFKKYAVVLERAGT